MSFEHPGRLVGVSLDDGESVVRGQVMAQLDTRQLRARRRELVAQHDSAGALLAEYKAGPRIEDIQQARAKVAQLSADHERLQIRSRRVAQLLKRDAANADEADESRYAAEASGAALDGARFALAEMLAGTRKERIDAQAAAVEALAGRIAQVDVDLADSVIRSPFDGVVHRRFVDEGAVLNPGQPVFELVESQAMELRVGLSQDVAHLAKQGVTFDVAVAGRSVRATVTRVLPQLDDVTRTVGVVLSINITPADPSEMNGPAVSGEALRPGQIARLRLPIEVEQTGAWVPVSALTRAERGLWSVYVARSSAYENAKDSGGSGDVTGNASGEKWGELNRGDIAVRTDVEVLHTEGQRVFVRGPIRDGQIVIASGTDRIVNGQRISVMPQ